MSLKIPNTVLLIEGIYSELPNKHLTNFYGEGGAMDRMKAAVVVVSVWGLLGAGLAHSAFAGEGGHVKEVIKHAKEGIAHEKEAIKHLEEAIQGSDNAHAKEALEHAKESLKHAEESLAHAEQASEKSKGKAK
jgi:hypothetical protein